MSAGSDPPLFENPTALEETQTPTDQDMCTLPACTVRYQPTYLQADDTPLPRGSFIGVQKL
jgi:hypothetical protein